jgi:hypothetical protein
MSSDNDMQGNMVAKYTRQLPINKANEIAEESFKAKDQQGTTLRLRGPLLTISLTTTPFNELQHKRKMYT